MKGLLLSILLPAAPLLAAPSWRTVHVPVLPAGASLGPLWGGLTGNLYLWAETRANDVPTAHLLHWNGESWRTALKLPGQAPASVFGTNERNVFAAANKPGPAGGGEGWIYRSTDRGATWTRQQLPAGASGRRLGRIDGSYENVQVVLGGTSLMRFDGVAWGVSFPGNTGGGDGALAFSFQGPNEGYMVNGRGWGRWIAGAWKHMPAEFGFRQTKGLWGLRDKGGALLLFAVDDNQFSNGVRIWRFDAPAEDFQVEFEDSSQEEDGSAAGLWGSAEDDIYAIGRVGAGPGSGRVYHFDGTSWTRDDSMGPIPPPAGIHGTSRNDVWISLADGRLLHYSTAMAVSRKMSSTTAR